jgi:hypothetical protein
VDVLFSADPRVGRVALLGVLCASMLFFANFAKPLRPLRLKAFWVGAVEPFRSPHPGCPICGRKSAIAESQAAGPGGRVLFSMFLCTPCG